MEVNGSQPTLHAGKFDATASRHPGLSPAGEDCYVRALYPFASTEPSSLAFKPGDFIRVLTKLESGWWDGLLHGKRGWFPSNYVEEVEIVSSDDEQEQEEDGEDGANADTENAETEEDARTPELSRSALLGVSESVASMQELNSSTAALDLSNADASAMPVNTKGGAFWIPQTSSEGHVYFFNTITGKSTWDIPFEPMTDQDTRPVAPFTTPLTTGFRPPIESHPHAMPSPNLTRQSHEHFAGNRSSNGIHAASSTLGWRDANGDDLLAVDSPEDDGEILLFANPPPRQEQSSDASRLKIPSDDDERRQLIPRISKENSDITDISDLLLPYSQKFSTTLDSLVRSAESQDKTKYRILSSDLKSTTCEVFSSLGLAQHSADVLESPSRPDGSAPKKEDEAWYLVYTKVLAAITKLMVSSQRAANDWGTAEDGQKMLADAEALQGLVLSFITDVISQTITLPVDASLTSLFPTALPVRTSAAGWQGNALMRERSNTSTTSISLVQLSSEAVAEVESFKALIQGGIKVCKAKLRNHDQSANANAGSLVLKEAIDVLGKVRQMLAYLEQADLSPLDPPAGADLPRSPTITDFTKSKQSMYDSCASLMLAAQGVTDPALSGGNVEQSDRITQLNNAFAMLETAISSVVLNFEFMVQEYVAKYGQYDTHQQDTEIILGTAEPMRRRGRSTRSIGDDHSIDSPIILSASSFSTPATSTRSTFPQQAAHGQTPWFLEHEMESELSYDSKGNVKAGTLLALTERLTRHDNLDSVFNNTFLLTYRSFTTADELSSLLMRRFLIEPPQGLTAAQHDMWVDLKQRPVQLRVYNIFKSWMENFFVEPPNDATHEWLAKLKHFVRTVMAEHIANAPALVKLIEKRIVQGDVPFRKMTLNTTSQAPMPIVPRNLKKIRLLDLDALEVARQLTIMESNLYNKIKPTECLDKSWSKPDAAEGAENIKAMILHSNQITAWVAEAILYQTDLKKRVNLIKHFIMIAEKCRQLHNFSALTAIISGLNSAPIHRLRRTWDLLPARATVSAEDLNRLMNSSKNFSSYRDALHQTQPPCVPFLGVYLTDLTFIEDGNPNMSIKARHLINISKRQKTADVIREIQQYQAVPYCLQVVPEIQNYIRSCMDITRDISELYNISLEREPREREDEKIARLLQESGFL